MQIIFVCQNGRHNRKSVGETKGRNHRRHDGTSDEPALLHGVLHSSGDIFRIQSVCRGTHLLLVSVLLNFMNPGPVPFGASSFSTCGDQSFFRTYM